MHGQKCETVALLFKTFIPRRFLNRLYINIVSKKLEVKMSAYTSFISDVYLWCRKISLYHLVFLVIKISKC